MKNFTAVIERDADTGLYVAWVPGFPGAHSQGETLDELRSNLQEVIEMLLEDPDPRLEKPREVVALLEKLGFVGGRTPRWSPWPMRRRRQGSRPNPAAAERHRGARELLAAVDEIPSGPTEHLFELGSGLLNNGAGSGREEESQESDDDHQSGNHRHGCTPGTGRQTGHPCRS